MKRNSDQILDTIARKFVPDNVNLIPKVTKEIYHRKAIQQFRTRIIIAALLILAIFSAMMVTVPDIGKAMHRLFGFVPGKGIVDQGSALRILAEPVTKSNNGVSVTINEALLSVDKTVILFSIQGIDWEMMSHEENELSCIENPRIQLPDGTTLENHSGNMKDQEYRLVFSRIPTDVNEVNFILPCITSTLPGKSPENWVFPIRFVPAPPEITIIPVVEISPSPQTTESITASQPLLSVDKVIESEDGYILIGSIHSIVLPDGSIIDAGMQIPSLRFLDANGNEIYPEYAPEVDFPVQSMDSFPWAYKITEKNVTWPLKISLDSAVASFSGPPIKDVFDVGANPKDGQAWEVNKDYEIEGYKFSLVKIERRKNSYNFTIEKADPRIANIEVSIEGFPSSGGGGGGDNQGNFSHNLIFEGKIPSGKLTLVLSILSTKVQGSWSVTWQPDLP